MTHTPSRLPAEYHRPRVVQSWVGVLPYAAPDGDTLNAVYLLRAVAPVAVCGGFALAALQRGGRLVFAAALLLLLGVAYYDVTFLVLPARSG